MIWGWSEVNTTFIRLTQARFLICHVSDWSQHYDILWYLQTPITLQNHWIEATNHPRVKVKERVSPEIEDAAPLWLWEVPDATNSSSTIGHHHATTTSLVRISTTRKTTTDPTTSNTTAGYHPLNSNSDVPSPTVKQPRRPRNHPLTPMMPNTALVPL